MIRFSITNNDKDGTITGVTKYIESEEDIINCFEDSYKELKKIVPNINDIDVKIKRSNKVCIHL